MSGCAEGDGEARICRKKANLSILLHWIVCFSVKCSVDVFTLLSHVQMHINTTLRLIPCFSSFMVLAVIFKGPAQRLLKDATVMT